MRRQFLKQLMMSFAAVALLGAQAQIVDPETEQLRRMEEIRAKLEDFRIMERDIAVMPMALAC